MKKAKKFLRSAAAILVFGTIGGVFGLMLGRVMASSEIGFLPLYALLLVTVFVGIYLHIIVHEAGHLVCGLLTGYRFCSFRIGSLTLVRAEDGFVWKRYSLAGTGGQCLMSPPEMVDGRIPYVLYNLGGSLANFVLSAILALSSLLTLPLASSLLLTAALLGLVLGLANILPLQAGGMPNDGHNARSLGKNPAALRAFWTQMTINEQLTRGKRLRELPAEWFELPESLADPLVAAQAAYRCNRLLDEGNFSAADALMAQLQQSDAPLVEVHRRQLINDRLFLELVGENRPDVVDAMLDKTQQQFMKAMKTNLSILRTQYALALLDAHDAEKAAEILQKFEKHAAAYPYPGDAEAERELIVLADAKWEAMHSETH